MSRWMPHFAIPMNIFLSVMLALNFCTEAQAQNPSESSPPIIVDPNAPTASSTSSGQEPQRGSGQASVDPNVKPKYDDAVDFSFNPLQVPRDPFVPLKSQTNDDNNENEMDETKICQKKLLRFDINQMNLVGILRGSEAHALIVLPSGLSCVVQVGTRLGRRNGRVTQIKSSEVVILEEFTDFKNRKRPDTTTLVLAQ